jgi:hypothetical protein
MSGGARFIALAARRAAVPLFQPWLTVAMQNSIRG